MENVRFTTSHYYIIVENDLATIGLTNFILDEIGGEIDSIELPEVGAMHNEGDQVGIISFGDDTLDLYSPLSGEIVEINASLLDCPDVIQNSKDGDDWLFKICIINPDELNMTISFEEYKKYLEEI